jgi:hypothetical protein
VNTDGFEPYQQPFYVYVFRELIRLHRTQRPAVFLLNVYFSIHQIFHPCLYEQDLPDWLHPIFQDVWTNYRRTATVVERRIDIETSERYPENIYIEQKTFRNLILSPIRDSLVQNMIDMEQVYERADTPIKFEILQVLRDMVYYCLFLLRLTALLSVVYENFIEMGDSTQVVCRFKDHITTLDNQTLNWRPVFDDFMLETYMLINSAVAGTVNIPNRIFDVADLKIYPMMKKLIESMTTSDPRIQRHLRDEAFERYADDIVLLVDIIGAYFILYNDLDAAQMISHKNQILQDLQTSADPNDPIIRFLSTTLPVQDAVMRMYPNNNQKQFEASLNIRIIIDAFQRRVRSYADNLVNKFLDVCQNHYNNFYMMTCQYTDDVTNELKKSVGYPRDERVFSLVVDFPFFNQYASPRHLYRWNPYNPRKPRYNVLEDQFWDLYYSLVEPYLELVDLT